MLSISIAAVAGFAIGAMLIRVWALVPVAMLLVGIMGYAGAAAMETLLAVACLQVFYLIGALARGERWSDP